VNVSFNVQLQTNMFSQAYPFNVFMELNEHNLLDFSKNVLRGFYCISPRGTVRALTNCCENLELPKCKLNVS